MIHRIARWLGIVRAVDDERHRESAEVLDEARRELDASRRRREALQTRADLRRRVQH